MKQLKNGSLPREELGSSAGPELGSCAAGRWFVEPSQSARPGPEHIQGPLGAQHLQQTAGLHRIAAAAHRTAAHRTAALQIRTEEGTRYTRRKLAEQGNRKVLWTSG